MNENRRWLTIKETAQKLGMHPFSLYRLCGRGQIPAAKLGGKLLIDWRRLEAELERQIERGARGTK